MGWEHVSLKSAPLMVLDVGFWERSPPCWPISPDTIHIVPISTLDGYNLFILSIKLSLRLGKGHLGRWRHLAKVAQPRPGSSSEPCPLVSPTPSCPHLFTGLNGSRDYGRLWGDLAPRKGLKLDSHLDNQIFTLAGAG